MPKFRIDKRFWRSFFIYFLVYLIVVPLIYFILDGSSFMTSFRSDATWHILKIAGIALGIAIIVSLWGARDPELRKY